MGSADLRRIDALLQLRSALLRFRQSTSGVASGLRARLGRATADLERQRRRLEDEIQTLEERAGSDDDDERAAARRALAEAYASREDLRDQMRRLARASARHDNAAASWFHALESTVPGAAAFLAQKHAEASSYLQAGAPVGEASLSVADSSAAGFGAGIWSRSVRAGPVPMDPVGATRMEDLPDLPGGFSWIPISEIEESELPAADDFPKVSYATMRAGLNRLWTELIPMIGATPGADRRSCQEFDEAHGRTDPMGFVHEESLAHLWDQFFEERFRNHIRVAFDSESGRWSVDNGRHRIRVARDLGWRYVPGELIRVESARRL
ncbi:MAG TPA: hypothetical protein VLH75_05975 [Longimicrobiales bacterium]|nr:hypothetical protein [Longimicrobiales bacterium]